MNHKRKPTILCLLALMGSGWGHSSFATVNIPTSGGGTPPTIGYPPPPPPLTTGGISSTGNIGTIGSSSSTGGSPSNANLVPLNPELKACVDGTITAMNNPAAPINASTAKCDEQSHPLIMVPASGAAPLTGLYNIKGNRCPDNTVPSVDNQCVYKVEAEWKAKCMPNTFLGSTGKCTKATEFAVDYTIKQVGPPIPGLAPSPEVRSGTGAQRPTAILTMPAIALGQALSAEMKCPDLYPNDPAKKVQIGVDATGAPICGPDPNQQVISDMQDQMCDMQTTQVNANGGATTLCNPNLVVVKLFTLMHSVPACLSAGGVLVDPGNGSEVSASVSGANTVINGVTVTAQNVGSYNNKYICGLNALSTTSVACPAGWTASLQWKKTNAVTCDEGFWVNCGCNGGSCPSAVTVGGGGWINAVLPEQPYYRWKRTKTGNLCTGTCTCSTDYPSANSPCKATMNRVGCL